jgi:flavin-dependent dehydrogenase
VSRITIVGGGPAGSSAALGALKAQAQVVIHEPSRFPRHKVCGEFLSPEIAPVLEALGVWRDVERSEPSRLRRLGLHFPTTSKQFSLSDSAYGLSRHCLDHLLLQKAVNSGALLVPERYAFDADSNPVVLACGRRHQAPRGRRLFGFKAHFSGPIDDSMDLYFFQGGYCGVNAVEKGMTNVCGIASEDTLKSNGYHFECLLHHFGPLADRIEPLRIETDWVVTGPLVFGTGPWTSEPRAFLAGDALCFVDPFTGTGISAAVFSGASAGRDAALGLSPGRHMKRCRRALGRPSQVARIFRALIQSHWAEKLVDWVPGRVLVQMTRPLVTH